MPQDPQAQEELMPQDEQTDDEVAQQYVNDHNTGPANVPGPDDMDDEEMLEEEILSKQQMTPQDREEDHFPEG